MKRNAVQQQAPAQNVPALQTQRLIGGICSASITGAIETARRGPAITRPRKGGNGNDQTSGKTFLPKIESAKFSRQISDAAARSARLFADYGSDAA
jgi:hypothetical protein